MTKYKLEYIWLDGYYADAKSARQNADQGIRFVPDAGAASAVGLRRQLDPAGRRPKLGLRAQAGRGLSGCRPHQRRAGDVRSHDARRQDPASDQQARHHSRRRRRLVRFRAGIFLLQGRSSARLSERRLSRAAGPVLHRRRLLERRSVAREIVEKHLDLCLAAGINHEGINAEVAKGQWEFQIFGKGSRKAADEMWMARYLLQRARSK